MSLIANAQREADEEAAAEKAKQPDSSGPVTSWQRLMEGDGTIGPTPEEQKTTMHLAMNIEFNGTYAEFTKWVGDTFKEPSGLRITVQFGDKPVAKPPALPPVRDSKEHPDTDLALSLGIDGATKPERAMISEGLREIDNIARAGNKINAIKLLRTIIPTCGLKEGKDFVDNIAARETRRLLNDRVPLSR